MDAQMHVGQPEGDGDLFRLSPFAHQSGEALPAGHLVGVEPGDILDEGDFKSSGIVAGLDDGAGQWLGLAHLLGHLTCGMEAPPARNDLIIVRDAIGPNNERHEHRAP